MGDVIETAFIFYTVYDKYEEIKPISTKHIKAFEYYIYMTPWLPLVHHPMNKLLITKMYLLPV